MVFQHSAVPPKGGSPLPLPFAFAFAATLAATACAFRPTGGAHRRAPAKPLKPGGMRI